MVRVCAMENCKTSARFNLPGESKGKFCSKHKEPGMVDIVHPHCKIEGCTTLASFNMSGQSRGEYCSQHKLEGMVNVKHRQCAEAGCATRPAFNWRGEEKGIYCNKHKEKGMINVDKKDAAARPGVEDGVDGVQPQQRKRARAAPAQQPVDAAQQLQQQAEYEAAVARQQQQQQHLPAELAGLQADGTVNGYGSMPQHVHLGPYGHPDYARSIAEYHGLPSGALDAGLQQQLAGHHLGHLQPQPGGVQVADMSQASWPQQHEQQQHAQSLDLAPSLPPQEQQQGGAADGHHMGGLPPPLPTPAVAPCYAGHSPPPAGGPAQQQYGDDGHQQQQPSLPSPEELRASLAEGNPGAGDAVASSSGTLGHIMLATVIKFTRELAAAPMEQGAREALCAYIDAFSRWDEAARIEQYAMLHFDWATRAGDAQRAVMARVEKVLAGGA